MIYRTAITQNILIISNQFCPEGIENEKDEVESAPFRNGASRYRGRGEIARDDVSRQSGRQGGGKI